MTTSRGRPGEQGQRARRARPGELGVRLVDDDQRALGRVVDGRDHVEVERRAGRVVRRAEEHDVGPVPPHLLDGGCRVEVERSAARYAAHPVDPRRAGRRGDDRVHRVGRGEAERGATGAAERLQQVQEDLVRAVARPDLLGVTHGGAAAREVGREALAQVGELPVGVAVQPGGDLGHGRVIAATTTGGTG